MKPPPAELLAAWPQPNYVDPDRRGPALLIVELIVMPIAFIVVFLRIYTRHFILRRLWWDDWLMVIAAIFSAGTTVAIVLAYTRYGWNVHIWDLRPDLITLGRKISLSAQTLFIIACGLTKLSILVSYIRIAVTMPFRRVVDASIVIVAVLLVSFVLAVWTQCNPIQWYWQYEPPGYSFCTDEAPVIVGQTTTSLITDVLVYVLPMPSLWRLTLPRIQRIGLLSLFAMGGFVCVASLMRLYYAWVVLYKTYDPTWTGFELWIWTSLEVNLGVICGSAPTLKSLLTTGSKNKSSDVSNGDTNTFGGGGSHGTNSTPRNRSDTDHYDAELAKLDAEDQWEDSDCATALPDGEDRMSKGFSWLTVGPLSNRFSVTFPTSSQPSPKSPQFPRSSSYYIESPPLTPAPAFSNSPYVRRN